MSGFSFTPRVRALYGRVMARLGLYKLHRMLDAGLPRSLETPLSFLFGTKLSHSAQQVVERVELIRENVSRQTRPFEVVNPHDGNPARTAAQVAHRSSVASQWGAFLYLCAESFESRTILELGSCAGISGSYLASSRHCTRFVTVEGSKSLASLAQSNIDQVSSLGEVVNALFDDALDQILETLGTGIDLFYLDGHHDYAATLHYLRRVELHLNQGALVVLDDIHWSPGMWQAWQVVTGLPGVAYAIDVGRFGLCIWEGASTQPVHYDLRRYLGWLRLRNVYA